VGELLAAALAEGARRIVVGVGGSATTDGGSGALEALHAAGVVDAFRGADVRVCCDVTTPFTDAARVFAPQKGADAAAVARLTERLARVRREYVAEYGVDPEPLPGSGAAGGLAGGLAVLNARLVGGADLIADEVGLDAALSRADLVITGEGLLDETSLAGKVVAAGTRRARAAGVPAVVIAGDAVAGVRPEDARVVTLLERVGRARAFGDTVAALVEVATGVLADAQEGT
jgi:glycerate kinase